ncbi:FAD-dependent oxidoreductase [Salmonella enterica]|nr:FAD-dependent oxidoreductase [Salmonella enterica]
MTHVTSAIIVGGGIGGAATALSLARQGIKVMLLEKAHEIGEIGAGIQLGPNAFSALDSLGVGDVARQRAVFTDHITMMDAVNAEEVVCIETGQAFRDHFGGPYAVIHRVDIHATVWEAVLTHPGVEYRTSTHIVDIRQTPDDVTVFDEQGNSWTADILVGCDGVKSVVRQSLLGDAQQAFALYESVRIPRTARIVWSTREMGRLYHAAGVERQVRNLLWKGKSQEAFYRGIEWLYGWKEDNCLEPR